MGEGAADSFFGVTIWQRPIFFMAFFLPFIFISVFLREFF